MLRSSEGVAAAKRAAAESLPFLPHSYELTPHWRRRSGTGSTMLAGFELSQVWTKKNRLRKEKGNLRKYVQV